MDENNSKKCFVFHKMDWVEDILHMSDLGLWNMVADQNMRDVKFYIDTTMARLLGLKENLTPEECFEFWYKRINRGNYSYVNEVLERIAHSGKLCEVQYTWNHPEWGDIPVRCAGISRKLEDGRLFITGYHQNMSNLDQMKRWSMNVSWDEVFEYNMTSSTALIYTDRKLTYGEEQQIQGFPQIWVDEGMVHPQYKKTFLQMFQSIKTGGEHARCEVKLRNCKGEYSWFAVELEILAYEEERPELVLGRIEDIARQKELESAYLRQARVNQLILEDTMAYGEADLTDDRTGRLHGTWKRYTGSDEKSSYSLLAGELERCSVKPEYRAKFHEMFTGEHLITQFEAGKSHVSMQYQSMFEGDKLRKVQLDVYLYQDPDTEHVWGVFCLRNMEEAEQSGSGRPAVLSIGIDASDKKEEPIIEGKGGSVSFRQEAANKVISCVYAMIEAGDMDESMSRLMDVLADHYEAGLIQIFLKQENGYGYECIGRRDEHNRPSVCRELEAHVGKWLEQNHQSEVRVINEPHDILPESFELYHDMVQDQIANMAVFPIVCRKGELGYLVILDRKSQNSLDLVNMLLYFVAQELNKRMDAKRLQYSIYYDALTGLLNRSSYDGYRRAYKADNVVSLGVIIIDINDLKSINDLRGTEAGDELIRQTAGIIEKQFKGSAIFRLNSNEFDIVIENISCTEFEHRFSALMSAFNSKPNLSVSAGRVWDDREKNLDWVMKQAGELMRIDKQRYYESKPDLHGSGRLELIKRLLRSIERGEFQVVLQPKLYLKTGVCAGAEALIRYCHPEKGTIMPSRFIGILERENLIGYVDLFVFEECCRLLEHWQKMGYRKQILSFNFSRMTLLGTDLISSVSSVARKYDVEPQALEVEVTESIGELGRDMVYKALAELKRMGYRISLDDFGTKYSNMEILSDVEFDVLKLDKSLVDKIDRDKVSGQIVKHIISMCNDMKIQTIAEGIEEELQASYLKKCRCMIGQGYLYGKPMAVEEYEKRFLKGI